MWQDVVFLSRPAITEHIIDSAAAQIAFLYHWRHTPGVYFRGGDWWSTCVWCSRPPLLVMKTSSAHQQVIYQHLKRARVCKEYRVWNDLWSWKIHFFLAGLSQCGSFFAKKWFLTCSGWNQQQLHSVQKARKFQFLLTVAEHPGASSDY